MDSWQQLAEQRIVEAQREGKFDNLEGFGKPLCLDDDDPNWWIKAKMRREGLSLLPPALVLARFVEREVQRIMAFSERSDVQAGIERLNKHIQQANLKICWGPPSFTQALCPQDLLAKWSQQCHQVKGS